VIDMALSFPYVNESRAATDYIGRQWFRLKEAMVAAGWTVRGSGDGSTEFAFDTTEEGTATAGGASTLTDSGQSWTTNIWATGTITITKGTGIGQTRTISSNTGTVITVSSPWTTPPDGTSGYRLSKTAATPGSGGSYDVWVTGNARDNSTPAVTGDAGNQSAWCLLENRGASCLRQVLLQTTSGTGVGVAGWSGYGNLIYNPGVSGGMLGLVADANSAPGAGFNEYIIYGSRDGSGASIVGFNMAGYYTIWYDDTPGADGGLTVGMISIDTSTETVKYLIFAALDSGAVHPSDKDPFVVLTSTAAPTGGTPPNALGWSEPAGTVVGVPAALGAPWYGVGDLIASTDSIAQMFAASTTGGSAYGKGRISKSAAMASNYARSWGDRGTDQAGMVFVALGSSGGMLVPWSDEAVAPLPGTNTTLDFLDVTYKAGGAITYYGQRVWSSGLNDWCYYEQTAVNPTPLSGETTPNWTGSISNHEVLYARNA